MQSSTIMFKLSSTKYSYAVECLADASHLITLVHGPTATTKNFTLAALGLRTEALERHMASLTDDQCAEFFPTAGAGAARTPKPKPAAKKETLLAWNLVKPEASNAVYPDASSSNFWLQHGGQHYLAVALPTADETQPMLLAELSEKQRGKAISGEWPLVTVLRQAKGWYWLKDYNADTVEVKLLHRVPKEWMPA